MGVGAPNPPTRKPTDPAAHRQDPVATDRIVFRSRREHPSDDGVEFRADFSFAGVQRGTGRMGRILAQLSTRACSSPLPVSPACAPIGRVIASWLESRTLGVMNANSHRGSSDVDRPPAVLVGIQLQGVPDEALSSSLDELERLTKTLGLRVVGRVTQKRRGLGTANLLGEGKLTELAQYTGGPGFVPRYASPQLVGRQASVCSRR